MREKQSFTAVNAAGKTAAEWRFYGLQETPHKESGPQAGQDCSPGSSGASAVLYDVRRGSDSPEHQGRDKEPGGPHGG